MIDILLSTYNGEKYLEEQLNSLMAQSFQDFCLLIRDDCSNDSTVNILKAYKNKYDSKIVLIDNKGINLGSTNSFFELLKHSLGDLIFFCDQDDVWNSNKLKEMIHFFNSECLQKDQPVLIHSAVEVVDENLCLMPIETKRFNKSKCGMEKDLKWQIFQNDVTGCTVMINASTRSLVNKIDFTSHKVIQHDWFLALLAYVYGSKMFYPESTIKYRQHANNVISAKQKTFFEKIQIKNKTGFVYPYYDQVNILLPLLSEDNRYLDILKEFSMLKNKNKIVRILWHVRHNFFRQGNVFYKLYQLLAC